MNLLLHTALMAAALIAASPAAAAGSDARAEVALRWDARSANPRGPLAAAEALEPGIAPPLSSGALLQAELRDTWRTRLGGAGVALAGNLLLAHERLQGSGGGSDRSRVNELHGSLDLGAWQASAGKKVLGWDVGYGFRPNDVVQQEERRTLFGQTPEGRPLVQLERFSAETAWSLVWVNPERWRDDIEHQRGPRESALAARWYTRAGAADWHVFARHGRHTGASLGAAVSWVASDELELHASARVFERHDGLRLDPAAGGELTRSNPWFTSTLGGATAALVGGQWTGALQQSLLVEYWHDGNALPDAAWSRWQERNQALAALAAQPGLLGTLQQATAGNLAWQGTPISAGSLRRDNLYVRLAWQPDAWQLSIDALVHPADRGRIVTAALQWQGDRVRINASWRVFGGPYRALLAQLPTRSSALLAASIAF